MIDGSWGYSLLCLTLSLALLAAQEQLASSGSCSNIEVWCPNDTSQSQCDLTSALLMCKDQGNPAPPARPETAEADKRARWRPTLHHLAGTRCALGPTNQCCSDCLNIRAPGMPEAWHPLGMGASPMGICWESVKPPLLLLLQHSLMETIKTLRLFMFIVFIFHISVQRSNTRQYWAAAAAWSMLACPQTHSFSHALPAISVTLISTGNWCNFPFNRQRRKP